ncbi:hypothetical protein BT93_F2279 [Corymbia citriodora subsp. variegata]|nr:hypothetical protein BT93_F2279 [Corymbia citriodora subsp. variegata]
MHVRGLHHSIGEMTRLEYLSLERCCLLETLPESIGKLKSLLELELDSMETTGLPHSIGDLKMLRKMSLVGTWIKKPPDQMGVTPKIEWIEGLSNLEVLVLAMKEFTFPPINLATLSRLWRLEITLVDPRSLMGLPSRLSILVLYNVKSPIESSLFSNLTNLSSLSLRDCWLREVDFDDVLGQHPEKLHRLLVTNDQLLERLSLSKLKGLQSLAVSDCPGLLEIQGGEKLESLEGLFISRCSSLERLPDLSELKKLQSLQLYDCPLTNSPGLRLQDTCSLIFARCGISAHFLGKYKEWKDTYGHSGDDINGQL